MDDHLESDFVTAENLSEPARTAAISGFIYEVDYGDGDVEYSLLRGDKSGDKWYTLVGPAQFTYEIPAAFNRTAAKLATLEAEKVRVRSEFAARVAELDQQIGKLQALEMTVEA